MQLTLDTSRQLALVCSDAQPLIQHAAKTMPASTHKCPNHLSAAMYSEVLCVLLLRASIPF
eukprot:5827117-Pleurochrysis_carterae.AAC.1